MTDIAWIKQRPIAHRGYHDLNKTRWENTLSAFAAAVDKNYAIECDVHLSADGVPVVFHDHDLKRLTGSEGYIWQRTAAELQALSIGGTARPCADARRDAGAGRRPRAAGDRAQGHSRP